MRAVLSQGPEPGSRLEAAGGGGRELFSARVLKADAGERAEAASSPGGHAHPQAQVGLAGRL